MPENPHTTTREEFLLEIDDILGLKSGTLHGSEKLDELQNWDSTALVGLIALAETANGTQISPEDVVGCATVGDLLRLAGFESAAS